MLAVARSLALIPLLFSALTAGQVYLYPPPTTTQPHFPPAGLSALLAHHWRLEAFAPPVAVEYGEIVIGGSRPFVGDNARDALALSLDVTHPEDVVPENLHPSFSVSALTHPSKSPLEHFSRIAQRNGLDVSDTRVHPSQPNLSKFLDTFPFSLSSLPAHNALEKFLASLSAVAAFVDGNSEGGDRFGAFDLTGLSELERESGRDSEIYRTAATFVKATIRSAMSSDAISLVVINRPFSSHLKARQSPISPSANPNSPTGPVFSTSTCFTSAEECLNATSSCSSRGQCVGTKRASRTCFVCACTKAPLKEGGANFSWAGSMCHKQDISQQFSLLVGTVIFLIVVSFGLVVLLYDAGAQPLPGTLTGVVARSPKGE